MWAKAVTEDTWITLRTLPKPYIITEALNQAEVVKNPDSVRFCDHENREIRTIKVPGKFLLLE